MISRRSFLHTLGIAAAGIAFRPAANFSNLLVPADLIPYDGPASMQWILADAIALLAGELPAQQFRHVAQPTRLAPGAMQLGVDLALSEDYVSRSRDEIREVWLKPAMWMLAEEIRERKISTCFALQLPQGIETAARIAAPQHGLDLRFVRAYDVGAPAEEYTDKETGELIELAARPPGFVSRFDLLAA